jgi:hypothetical protein
MGWAPLPSAQGELECVGRRYPPTYGFDTSRRYCKRRFSSRASGIQRGNKYCYTCIAVSKKATVQSESDLRRNPLFFFVSEVTLVLLQFTTQIGEQRLPASPLLSLECLLGACVLPQHMRMDAQPRGNDSPGEFSSRRLSVYPVVRITPVWWI